MTNGERIQSIFPNITSRLDAEAGMIITKWADNTTKCFKASWWNAEYKEPITKNDSGVDCVSRAYLLDDIRYHTVFNDDTGNFEDVVYREDIEKAPSVTPQPKTGHWIPTYGNVKCSVCGSVKDSREVGKATHYCDFCGAKMESEEV